MKETILSSEETDEVDTLTNELGTTSLKIHMCFPQPNVDYRN